jgi:hypothetical protein
MVEQIDEKAELEIQLQGTMQRLKTVRNQNLMGLIFFLADRGLRNHGRALQEDLRKMPSPVDKVGAAESRSDEAEQSK